MKRPVLTARHYALLALGSVAFTVYGSLVPFEFVTRPWSDVVDGFWRVAEQGVGIGSRSDFLANCLLGGPLGFCLLGALQVDRRRWGFMTGIGVWLVCVAVAIVVEFSQAYCPTRTAALSDVVAQSIGAVVGIAVWLGAGQRFTDWVRVTWSDPLVGTAERFLAGYLVVVVVVQLLPLDLTISPAVVYRKLRDGHATLIPFSEWGDAEVARNRWGKVQAWLELIGLYLPAGMLVARWRPSLNVLGVLAGGLAFAAATELGQFLVSRHPSVTDVLIGACGVVVGWGVARRTQPLRLERTFLLWTVWFAVLAVVYWQPFDFVSGPDAIEERFAAVNWLPFADLAARNYLGSLDLALERLILFVPLGVLVATTQKSLSDRRAGRVGAVVGFVVALTLELWQFFLPGRFPSTTDLITGAFGAWIGATVARRILAR